MVFNFNLFENINFNFDCFKDPSVKEFKESKSKKGNVCISDIYKSNSPEYNVYPLALKEEFNITDLFPSTNHVELWNIFIVGREKTYIQVSINDNDICIPNKMKLLNKKGENLIPDELEEIFNNIWDTTLMGNNIQIILIWNSIPYLVNTYSFKNSSGLIIGAILFMRRFDKVQSYINRNTNSMSNFNMLTESQLDFIKKDFNNNHGKIVIQRVSSSDDSGENNKSNKNSYTSQINASNIRNKSKIKLSLNNEIL